MGCTVDICSGIPTWAAAKYLLHPGLLHGPEAPPPSPSSLTLVLSELFLTLFSSQSSLPVQHSALS